MRSGKCGQAEDISQNPARSEPQNRRGEGSDNRSRNQNHPAGRKCDPGRRNCRAHGERWKDHQNCRDCHGQTAGKALGECIVEDVFDQRHRGERVGAGKGHCRRGRAPDDQSPRRQTALKHREDEQCRCKRSHHRTIGLERQSHSGDGQRHRTGLARIARMQDQDKRKQDHRWLELHRPDRQPSRNSLHPGTEQQRCDNRNAGETSDCIKR